MHSLAAPELDITFGDSLEPIYIDMAQTVKKGLDAIQTGSQLLNATKRDGTKLFPQGFDEDKCNKIAGILQKCKDVNNSMQANELTDASFSPAYWGIRKSETGIEYVESSGDFLTAAGGDATLNIFSMIAGDLFAFLQNGLKTIQCGINQIGVRLYEFIVETGHAIYKICL